MDEPSNPASALVALSKADGMAQGRRIIVKCPYVITSSSWLYSLAVGFLGATEVTKAEAQAGLNLSTRRIGDVIHTCLSRYQDDHPEIGHSYIVHLFYILQLMLQGEIKPAEVREKEKESD